MDGVLLAHQGGWDELLMVAVPIGLFAALLWLANRRANAGIEPEPAQDPSLPGPDVGSHR